MSAPTKTSLGFGQSFLNFLNSSPTPFHVCTSVSFLLDEAGFVRVHENVPWLSSLKPGGKYYFTRNGSSLVAFLIGSKYKPGNPYKIIGAHTDSPVLRVKPVSKQSSLGVEQLGIECYGGGLWHTWLDRDLGIAGRVIVYTGKETFQQRLVHISTPILRIPSLCIHLQTGDEISALKINKQDNLVPVMSMISSDVGSDEASKVKKGDNGKKNEEIIGKFDENESDLDKRHSPTLLRLLAEKAGCNPADIVDIELSLCDTQKSCFGGANGEFVFSGRLDNQISCFTSINALIDYSKLMNAIENDSDVSVVALFDHEEVGSDSNEGAGSPLVRDSVERITRCMFEQMNPTTSANANVADDLNANAVYEELIRVGLTKSILFSCDSAHAVHPNYSSKHDRNHQPLMGNGTVIKTNQNQRYSTNAVTGFFVRELCRRHTVPNVSSNDDKEKVKEASIPFQEFSVRNDVPCGSTIGPILAHGVGLRTVDIGVPQLSMHSIREQGAVKDVFSNYCLLKAFFQDVTKIDKNLSY